MYTTKRPTEERPLVVEAPKARRQLHGRSGSGRFQDKRKTRAHAKREARHFGDH